MTDWRAAIDVDRLVSFRRLLALPDPWRLPTRGHRVTVPGTPKHERFQGAWWRFAKTWTQHELTRRTGDPMDGWKPARREPTRIRRIG